MQEKNLDSGSGKYFGPFLFEFMSDFLKVVEKGS